METEILVSLSVAELATTANAHNSGRSGRTIRCFQYTLQAGPYGTLAIRTAFGCIRGRNGDEARRARHIGRADQLKLWTDCGLNDRLNCFEGRTQCPLEVVPLGQKPR